MTTTHRLGKHPRKNDRRTLKLAKYLDIAALPPAPAVRTWSPAVLAAGGYGMLLNDQLGCCVPAGCLHLVMEQADNQGTVITMPSDQDVIAAYSAMGGYVSGDSSTDQGCNILDALKILVNPGVSINGAVHQAGAFAEVDVKDPAEMAAAMNLFGGLLIGVQLPVAVQNATSWTGPTAPLTGDWEPGSWGGHCVILADNQNGAWQAVTWGSLMPTDQAFLADFCDEAYAVLDPADWAAKGTCPSGFAVADLKADLARIQTEQGSR